MPPSDKKAKPAGTVSVLMKRSLPVLSSLVVLFLSILAAAMDLPVVGTLRNNVFDTYQRWKPREYQPAPVRILDIDDESLQRVGQWPWSRATLAEVVDRLRDLGAAAIALDVVFAEPDRTAPTETLGRWLKDDPQIRALVARLPDPDRVFSEEIGRGSVVTGFVLNQEPAGDRIPALKASVSVAGDDPRSFLPAFSGAVNSLAGLEAAAAGNGALNVAPSRDGVVRQVQLMLRLGDQIYPNLTAEALRVARGGSYLLKASGASGESRSGGRTGMVSVRIGDLPVLTDPKGSIWMHFSESVPERSIPAWKLLEGKVTAEQVADTILFVGTSAAGLKDLRFNALGSIVAGAEMHAQAAEQILQGTYLSRPDWAKAVEILAMVVMWAMLVVLILRFGALPAALVGFLVVGGALLASWQAFSQFRLLLDPIYPSLMSVAVYLVCSVSKQLRTERERRWIRDAFSSYISPNLVRYLLDNPDELELGGERRTCSFVMSDLEGFTSLVERSEPAEVVTLLNEYLDGMVSIAQDHEGTIDRIVGDAVAVMFSAPVRQPDHAQRAVACALAMDEFAESFRKRKLAEGIHIGVTRVGVNTGTVTIGNVGGEALFDYRALGDAVNVTARLETVNRHLGTRVCVSGTTAARCPGFRGRPVGDLVLKGKSEAVEAFQPLAAGDADAPATAAYLEAWELLRNEDPEAEAAFLALAAASPNDPLAALHLVRLRRGETGTRVVLASK